ncbi:MAG: esterase-like activity of phytase family protein [Candidatus Devosia phytovorans]|uniref:Esterase-like activity of phytase family protein n=1 Tax=Candidatus Devosia phytovorans TaxID=3121372 RepID=A0AAJ6B0V7_9HYPH|nr:esterase-like activity of phytase family protein [Devosia sp.]WEK04644.1 MAG: esterase-like activity of phytase family protein [Devosia sp.]
MRLAVLAAALMAGLGPALGVEATVNATQISSFRDVAVGGKVDRLIFRGGMAMTSPDDTFGGLSGMTMTGPNGQALFVTDRGSFVTGYLAYDDAGQLFGFIGVTIEPMRNSKGEILPRQYAKDAESVDTVYRDGVPVAARVSFEHLTRVADFALTNGIPGGPAREVSIPQWLTDLRTNESLESVCVAPPASLVAGSTLLLTENYLDAAGNHRGYLLGQADKGEISYVKSPAVNPTECAFLPNGDLLVLERGVSMLTFVMNLRRVKADQVRAGNVMAGELLLSASGGSIDNMEAMTVHQAPGGETRILIGSDNNFNDWQRSLLLEFALVD